MILFRNVTKKYDNGVTAVSKVNFFVEKGEFVFIVGASGAGKSTITKLILCEEHPSAGHVFVNNVDLSSLKRADMPYYRRTLGVVFQDFRLLPHKTVYENVAFALQVRGATRKEIRRTVPNVLALVGLSHRAKAKPLELAGGEQQRTAIARAMVSNPPLLIADEPTGNLDPANAAEIMFLLDFINKKGTTVLAVTHSKEAVNKMQKRVIEIDKGIIVRDERKGKYRTLTQAEARGWDKL